jgi:parallel beta-helix repeat protein
VQKYFKWSSWLRIALGLSVVACTSPGLADRIEADGVPSPAFVVSPRGNDAWSGRLAEPNRDGTDGPFATLARARDAMREHPDIATTYVRGGHYHLTETLRLNGLDSNHRFIAYENETPVLHGGPAITGWTRGTDGIWTARVPAGLPIDELFVVGIREPVARHPNFDSADPIRGGWLFAVNAEAKDYMTFRLGDIPDQADPSHLKINIFSKHGWASEVKDVASIDYHTGTITFMQPTFYDVGKGSRYFLFDDRAMLDAHGEWFFDKRAQTVYYKPRDTDFSGQDVVGGSQKTLIRIDDASNIVIRGLDLRDTAAGGDPEVSGGTVEIRTSRGIQFSRNVLKNVGIGVIVRDSDNVRITNTEISSVAGTAIYLTSDANGTAGTTGTVIANNWIHDVGTLYKTGSGIFFHGASDTLISHNLIEDLAKFGIGGGSIWMSGTGARDPSYRNVIEYNTIRNANRESSDGGAIMLAGIQQNLSGDIIRYNTITGTSAVGTDAKGNFLAVQDLVAWAIYLDDWASGIEVLSNVIDGNSSGGIFVHGGWNNTIRNNIIADGGTGMYALGIHEDVWIDPGKKMAANNRFTGNIVILSNGDSKAASVIGDRTIALFNGNLYWGAGLNTRPFNIWPQSVFFGWSGNLQNWQRAGFDTRSVVEDPRIIRVPDGLRLAPDSPAYNLGFRLLPWDRMQIAGITNDGVFPD